MTIDEKIVELPEQVIELLFRQQKIEAIKLLRESTGLGLTEAKKSVEDYMLAHAQPQHSQTITVERTKSSGKTDNIVYTLKTIILIVTFVWMMINIVSVAGSLIIILNKDGYEQSTFIVDTVFYQDDHEAGLSWGFRGRLPQKQARMLAPALADAKLLQLRGLRRLYPTGTLFNVWYNPNVTETLFQKRSLHLIPYVDNIVAEEMKHISWWGKYCLLPFIIVLFLSASTSSNKNRE